MGPGTEQKKNGKSSRMVLFVADHEINSEKARVNLSNLCKDHLGGRGFEVVDVFQDHSKALKWKVFLTPALLVFSDTTPIRITGNLEQTDRVLVALGAKEKGHGAS